MLIRRKRKGRLEHDVRSVFQLAANSVDCRGASYGLGVTKCGNEGKTSWSRKAVFIGDSLWFF
jgi:hypothetical protein